MNTETEAKRRSCDDCKFGLSVDDGYSNYTVTGTTEYCMVNAHPSGIEGFDRFYGENQQLYFAEQCEKFVAGEGIHIDVDEEEMLELAGEQKALYEAWCSSRNAAQEP